MSVDTLTTHTSEGATMAKSKKTGCLPKVLIGAGAVVVLAMIAGAFGADSEPASTPAPTTPAAQVVASAEPSITPIEDASREPVESTESPAPEPEPATTTEAPAAAPEPEPAEGLDPDFGSCAKANDAGYGNYRKGVDEEYGWYRDADKDGIVCEY